jgi:hypothetical protein
MNNWVGKINAPFAILRDGATCSATGAYLVTRVRKNIRGFTVLCRN